MLATDLYIISRRGVIETPNRQQLLILKNRLRRIGSVLEEGLRSPDVRVAGLALAVIARHASEASL